jgi:hypothetical protein
MDSFRSRSSKVRRGPKIIGMAARETEVEQMNSAEEKSEDCLLLAGKIQREPQPIVAVLSWHRAYGEALLYAQSNRAAILISKAEQRIFVRYLEVAASPSSLLPEEERDLWNAVLALSELKKALALAPDLNCH